MWEHPDPSKRFTNSVGIIGFWRECILCGNGSTDLGPHNTRGGADPNYVAMIIVSPLPKKRRHLMKGQVYDNYWVVCDDCNETYCELMGLKAMAK